MPPVLTEYDIALDDAAQEWLRERIWTENGQVVGFTVQYETTLAGERVPVVRYDTAHGFAHRDRMSRSGKPVKDPLGDNLSLQDALQIAERDIRQHWQRYRQEFLRANHER
jgi:hypothetical protein